MEILVPAAVETFTMDAGFSTASPLMVFIPTFPQMQEGPSIVPCAAYDIGSGATKYMGALVNVETLTIDQVFSQGSFSIPYREDLNQSENNTFSTHIQELGLDALLQAHFKIEQDYQAANLNNYGDIQHFAIATAAFRAADNGLLVAEYFSDVLDMPINVISQEEEGKLAYYGAVSHYEDDALPIVWDIGGGSMQLTFKDPSDTFHIMEGEIASQTFQSLVSEKIFKFEDPTQSPNPMNHKHIQEAIDLAKEHLTFDPTTTDIIKNRVQNDTPVLAVGSVHNFVVQPLCTLAGIHADQNHYTKDDVRLAIDLLTDKTDQQIVDITHVPKLDLAKQQVTNLILVYAMMDLMGIEKVQTIKSSNTEGLMMSTLSKPIKSPIYVESVPNLQLPQPNQLHLKSMSYISV